MSSKADIARNLRYKRPALMSLGYEHISSELYDIREACGEVQWFVDNDGETLLNALDGDDETEYEFRMAFADLQTKTDSLDDALREWDIRDTFDDCTVGLLGNRYKTVGFDSIEEDYYSLTSFEQGLATTESGKKVMRMTKPEMISTIGQCMGITLAFVDVRQTYDYLKATFDILRNENTSLLMVIKDIEAAYEEACGDWQNDRAGARRKFDSFVSNLPDRIWIE